MFAKKFAITFIQTAYKQINYERLNRKFPLGSVVKLQQKRAAGAALLGISSKWRVLLAMFNWCPKGPICQRILTYVTF